MDPGQNDITIYQGASWKRLFVVDDGTNPIDITGCEIRAQIRKKPDAIPVIIDLNTPNEITLTDPTNGEFRIFISHVITSAMPDGLYQWDVFIEWPNGEDVDKVIFGDVELVPNVTEPSTNA